MEAEQSFLFDDLKNHYGMIVPCENTDWMTEERHFDQSMYFIFEFVFRTENNLTIEEWYYENPTGKSCYDNIYFRV